MDNDKYDGARKDKMLYVRIGLKLHKQSSKGNSLYWLHRESSSPWRLVKRLYAGIKCNGSMMNGRGPSRSPRYESPKSVTGHQVSSYTTWLRGYESLSVRDLNVRRGL